MVAIGVFFPVVINATTGVLEINKIYLDVGHNYKASRWNMFWTIALPGALPVIMTGFKLGIGIGLILIAIAEMVGAKSGLGYLIWSAWETFSVEQMYVGLFMIAHHRLRAHARPQRARALHHSVEGGLMLLARHSGAERSVEAGIHSPCVRDYGCRRIGRPAAPRNDKRGQERDAVLVIGAGVIGLAVARAAALRGHDVTVAEATGGIGNGISSRNSEVIHAGLYYPTNSQRARHCTRGRRMLYAFCASHGVAHRKCGKLVVATDSSNLPRSRRFWRRGRPMASKGWKSSAATRPVPWRRSFPASARCYRRNPE